MSAGDDYAWQHPSTDALKAAGITFVCRYLSRDPSKNLTKTEADELHAAGIATVSNWEYSAGAAKNGFSQGVADAQAAKDQHTACGGPADRPVYFSVDFDIPDYAPGSTDPAAKLGPVAAYFRGVASVIGLARTGAYGGYWAIKRLFDAGLITWGWQTYAWSGGQWDSRAHIRQVRNGVTIGGADTDLDTSMTADFGQWPLTNLTGDDMALSDKVYDTAAGHSGVNRSVEEILHDQQQRRSIDVGELPLTTYAADAPYRRLLELPDKIDALMALIQNADGSVAVAALQQDLEAIKTKLAAVEAAVEVGLSPAERATLPPAP